MKLPDRLEMPLKRLATALDHLEAAAERRAEADSRRGDLEEELVVMQDDRSRLAHELDGVMARAATGAAIRSMLGQPDTAEPQGGE